MSLHSKEFGPSFHDNLEDHLRKAGNGVTYFISTYLECIPNVVGVKCKSNYSQTSCDGHYLFCDMLNQNSKQHYTSCHLCGGFYSKQFIWLSFLTITRLFDITFIIFCKRIYRERHWNHVS